MLGRLDAPSRGGWRGYHGYYKCPLHLFTFHSSALLSQPHQHHRNHRHCAHKDATRTTSRPLAIVSLLPLSRSWRANKTDDACRPERLFARVWEEDDVAFPIPPTPAPSTPPALASSGLLIEIEDQPLPPAARIPNSVSAPVLATSSAGLSPSAAPFQPATARGPGKYLSNFEFCFFADLTVALVPQRAAVTPRKVSTPGAPGAAQNGSPQTLRNDGAPKTIGSPSGFQRQNGPTNMTPQRGPPGLAPRRYDSEPRLPPGKAHFPKGPGLETNREALTAKHKRERKEKEEALLVEPSEDSVFAAEVCIQPRYHGNLLTIHRVFIYGQTKHSYPVNY